MLFDQGKVYAWEFPCQAFRTFTEPLKLYMVCHYDHRADVFSRRLINSRKIRFVSSISYVHWIRCWQTINLAMVAVIDNCPTILSKCKAYLTWYRSTALANFAQFHPVEITVLLGLLLGLVHFSSPVVNILGNIWISFAFNSSSPMEAQSNKFFTLHSCGNQNIVVGFVPSVPKIVFCLKSTPVMSWGEIDRFALIIEEFHWTYLSLFEWRAAHF